MDIKRKQIRNALGTLVEGDLLPFISLLVVTTAALTVGIDYETVVNGIRLAFYAVLVAVWTAVSPSEPLEDGGNYAQFEFLMLCTAALLVGFGAEHALSQAAGRLYAIQAVGLIGIVSRLYVNSVGTSTLRGVLRLHSPSDRYLVYVPALVAVLVPVAWHQAALGEPSGYALGSPASFLLVAVAGVAVGGVAYALDLWLRERVFDGGRDATWGSPRSTDSVGPRNRVGTGDENGNREAPEHSD
jgi:hypothetical protein